MAVVIIPARLGATRLPGKPLKLLGKIPLVVRVAKQASKASGIDRVVVATDSTEIRKACDKHHVESCTTRDDHASGTDRVAEAAMSLSATHVINVQGDEPFIDPRDIEAISEALKRGASIASLRSPIQSRTSSKPTRSSRWFATTGSEHSTSLACRFPSGPKQRSQCRLTVTLGYTDTPQPR